MNKIYYVGPTVNETSYLPFPAKFNMQADNILNVC